MVEKVDHRGRCCLVRWMKPYQVGKNNKPDQSIVSEEVSVYDIKDHPDYKFRPGHVVVRVGGYEVCSRLALADLARGTLSMHPFLRVQIILFWRTFFLKSHCIRH